MQKIGLLGGSFNPAHFGHFYISCQALKKLDLCCVWWLFCKKNPLKDIFYKPFEIRAKSAKNLTKSNRKIKIINANDIYTYKTLKSLKLRFPEYKFIWMMGADSAISFHLWERWHEIGQSTQIVIFDRNRDLHVAMRSKFATRFHLGKDFFVIPIKKQNISSTAIRKSTNWGCQTIL